MSYGWKTELRRRRTKVRDAVDFLRERNSPIRSEQFSYRGTPYSYFVHRHNHTWRNERIVEVPVFLALLDSTPASQTLEVGNVLSHYRSWNHDVVDMYEVSAKRKIIREDVLDYDPDRTYDLIVSISTIEHVGWDDKVKRPERVLEVPAKLRQLVSAEGRAVISVPFGYNPVLDDALRDNDFEADRVDYLHRTSAENHWAETDKDTATGCQYGTPYSSANAIAICTYNGAGR